MKQKVQTTSTGSDHLLSQAITSNGFVFVSGQIHVDGQMKLVGETTREKVTQIMANIVEVLKSANVSLDDIVKVVIYVTDMSVMPELNEIYPSFFTGVLPAREAICVAALPLGASIEISVIAEEN